MGETVGKHVNTPDELDGLVVNCNYLFVGGDNYITISDVYNIRYGYGRVDSYDGSRAIQTLTPVIPEIASTLVRYKLNDYAGWSEWEWVNPPMHLDVEYRTTERWNGKVVYTQLINADFLPNATTKSLTVTDTGHVIRCSACGFDGGGSSISIPFNIGNDYEIGCHGQSGNIVLYTSYDCAGITAYVTACYTKD